MRAFAAVALAVAVTVPSGDAYAGPLDEPAGVPCRVESFRDLFGITWADPSHRPSVFAAGPWRVPGATSITIRCAVYYEYAGGRHLVAEEVNTTSGEAGVLVAGFEERWFGVGDPPVACTTVTWRSPSGGGVWPATGESCAVVDELPVIP